MFLDSFKCRNSPFFKNKKQLSHSDQHFIITHFTWFNVSYATEHTFSKVMATNINFKLKMEVWNLD